MITTTIFPGRYIQGADALHRLGGELKKFGEKGVIICSPFVYTNILPKIRKSLEENLVLTFEKFSGECSDEEINRLTDKIGGSEKTGGFGSSGFDFIAGIGGGKTLDTVRVLAHNFKSPAILVPTIASTDAPCSALSVIYTPDGIFKRLLMLPKNPALVLVDTTIIARAPARFLVSGMGDALATRFEAESCKNSYALNMSGDMGSMTAYALARLCYDTLLEYGLPARLACEQNVVTPALEHIVEANTLLSGIGFESGGLATSHSVHNGLTALKQTQNYYHGEKVAFGTLVSLLLTDKSGALIDEVYSFCESVGLPTRLDDIGLSGVTDDELKKVAEKACDPEEVIHNEAVPVSMESVFAAIKAADAYGSSRIKNND